MAGDKEAAFITLYTVLVTLSKVIAPFVLFMAESLYQNLVRSVDAAAPESVHLSDFPTCDESRIDPEMEKQMDALLEVIQLGRACRNAAIMKVRQPAQALYVKGAAFTEAYQALAEDELNVKQVVFTDDARAFTTYNLKPQMRTLGPKYGKLLGKIRQHLKDMDGNNVVDAFDQGQSVSFNLDDTAVTLTKDDVLTEATQKPGFMAQQDRGVMVVLDTNLTPELIQEGFAREVTSKIQTMRREADYDVTDRINLCYEAGETLSNAMTAGKEMILAGVLGLSLERGLKEGYLTREWDINGEKAVLGIQQA